VDRRATTCVVALLLVAAVPSPSLAVRGIDHSPAQPRRMTCVEALREGTRLRATLNDGTEIVGRLAHVQSEGIGLRVRGDEPSIAKGEITALHVENPMFPRPGASLLGLAVGTLVGGYIAATREEPPSADASGLPSIYRDDTVVFGAVAGLAIGTIVPLFHPGEKEIECAW
jgi:hypothetical protein